MGFDEKRLFEQEERLRSLLVYLAHLDSRHPVVITLHSQAPSLLTEPEAVTAEFVTFFSEVYASRVDYSLPLLCDFFG